ncbi:hypothetical protein J3R30DRAFT_3719535 [Lentinula aciculospora]|uniref:Uncharacterized protein n=1 Tax=Lentinula aciculospora TaxID=153920 RepID=A0A9W8ZTS0_9AGAR|nr:hypothetical protein J3R30DRAFT_3719535 [Lentinula aciculospora]
MATISIDVSAIFREVRLLITELKNERTADKEKAKAAQLLVYRALSLHPALDHMRPPTGMLADVDWYTELRSTFTSGIFRRLAQNEHFKKMALLGDTGARARIMTLLLWIVGHRLSEDSVAKLLSVAFMDGIKRDTEETLDVATELTQLDSVKKVLVSLRKMIKTKLPLPPGTLRYTINRMYLKKKHTDRNPFQGPDFNVNDEDKALPRSELWGYVLPDEQQYEYDIRRNPVLLLRPLPNKVIIPQTKLTVLIIQWAACNFGLGKKVYSAQDIDSEAFWNADPPLSDALYLNQKAADNDDSLSAWSSDSSEDSLPFEVHQSFATAPYERMWKHEPLEDWIHSRFCSVYPMHRWAHQSFVRLLLFNAFSGSQTLPTSSFQILTAIHITNQLSERMPIDVWKYAERFIIAQSLFLWREKYTAEPWCPVFSAMTLEERAMFVIFVDALWWEEAQPWKDHVVDHPPLFLIIREFLMDPLRHCPEGVDILSLPLLVQNDTSGAINNLPSLNRDLCICGECSSICAQLPTNLESFRYQYFSLTSSRPLNCDALARTWEPALSAAEIWLDSLLSRLECRFTLFPWTEELNRRIGPAALEVANALCVQIGSDLSDDQLLRFVLMLNTITDDFPPTVPKLPGPFGIGYVSSMPWAADREDYRISCSESGYGSDQVLVLKGGLLYDAVGLDGISLIHENENLRIVHHTTMPARFSAVCMPSIRGDSFSLFPTLHTSQSQWSTVPIQEHPPEKEGIITFVLSNWQTDAFPLLSVSSSSDDTGFSAPRGARAALIQVEFYGRLVETVWKPDVQQGIPCEHKDLWGCSTRCSTTAVDLFRQILPPTSTPLYYDNDDSDLGSSPLFRELRFSASKDAPSIRQKIIRDMFEEHARRVEPLTKAGSPLERMRTCMIRCGSSNGLVDAVVVLAASVKKKVYVLNHRLGNVGSVRLRVCKNEVGVWVYR